MKPTRAVLFAALCPLLVSEAAARQCREQIMACTLRGDTKHLQICLNGPNAVYKYGPATGAPELEIITAVSTLDYLPWPGIGRDIWETVTFANGSFRYEVAAGFSRPMGAGDAVPSPAYGSIRVSRDGTEIAQLLCDAGSVDWAYGGGLYDAKKALGLCWTSHPEDTWIPCPAN